MTLGMLLIRLENHFDHKIGCTRAKKCVGLENDKNGVMIKLECSLAKNIMNCKLSTTRTVVCNGQKDE